MPAPLGCVFSTLALGITLSLGENPTLGIGVNADVGWCRSQVEKCGRSHIVVNLFSPWHDFCSCCAPGCLGFLVFWTLGFDVCLTLGGGLKPVTVWCRSQVEVCGQSHGFSILFSPCYDFCICSVPGAVAFVAFRTTTLGVTCTFFVTSYQMYFN